MTIFQKTPEDFPLGGLKVEPAIYSPASEEGNLGRSGQPRIILARAHDNSVPQPPQDGMYAPGHPIPYPGAASTPFPNGAAPNGRHQRPMDDIPGTGQDLLGIALMSSVTYAVSKRWVRDVAARTEPIDRTLARTVFQYPRGSFVGRPLRSDIGLVADLNRARVPAHDALATLTRPLETAAGVVRRGRTEATVEAHLGAETTANQAIWRNFTRMRSATQSLNVGTRDVFDLPGQIGGLDPAVQAVPEVSAWLRASGNVVSAYENRRNLLVGQHRQSIFALGAAEVTNLAFDNIFGFKDWSDKTTTLDAIAPLASFLPIRPVAKYALIAGVHIVSRVLFDRDPPRPQNQDASIPSQGVQAALAKPQNNLSAGMDVQALEAFSRRQQTKA